MFSSSGGYDAFSELSGFLEEIDYSRKIANVVNTALPGKSPGLSLLDTDGSVLTFTTIPKGKN